MAQQSDSPKASLMDQHTDAGVDYCQPGRSDQPNLDTPHVAHDEQERPSDCGGDEGEPPPMPENQAEQDQSWDHGDSSHLSEHTVHHLVGSIPASPTAD